MKPLIILVLVFLIALTGIRFASDSFDYALAGRIAMSVMLLFTALGHFKFLDGMSRMLPAWFPARKFVVLFTGVIEIAAAIGLQIAALQALTAWLLILFFVTVLPANIHAAYSRLNYETGDPTGPGPRYLWFRIPMQLFLIAWVYVSAIAAS